MFVYLHGFNSAPQSFKARLLHARLAARGRESEFSAPALSHWPSEAIAAVEAMLAEHGDIGGVVAQQRRKAEHLYAWADSRDWARPFVADAAARSLVVATIDLEEVEADDVNAVLRANGIVDTDPYRKLGRNQLRIGFFPAVPLSDLVAFTGCVDHVVEHLA
jgi:phosphoserine aminotransferase